MKTNITMKTDIGDPLLDAIKSKDAKESLLQVQQFKKNMRDQETGANYVLWVTEPINLTSVHNSLVEDLGIPPRLLAIRRSSINRTQKAVLLIQAIENAIKRVHILV